METSNEDLILDAEPCDCCDSEPIAERFRRMTKDQLMGLSVPEWIRVLFFAPEHFKYCDFERFSGEDWVKLLKFQPYFRKICGWKKLSEDDWRYLIKRRPGFKKMREELGLPEIK